MEPNLIMQKTLKKILKKNYFYEESSFNKFIKIAANKVQVNWLPIVVVAFIFFILVFLYKEQKNKKKNDQENLEVEEEMKIINKKSKDNFENEFRKKSDYESEYYKMLPKITNNPEVIEYMY